jgi:nitrite reductase (NO-forming)
MLPVKRIMQCSQESRKKMFISAVLKSRRNGVNSAQTEYTHRKSGKQQDKKEEASINDIAQLGKNVYTTTCAPCHQAGGEGIANVFPPLAKSDYLNDKEATIKTVLNGLQGQITVNGKTYNGVMPPQNLTNEQTAAVLTYVYKNWGNSGKTVTPEEVEKLRGKK